MSAPSESNGRPSDPQLGEGVLANLPRTRPQRSSARRAAARKASAAPPATPASSGGRPASPTRTAPKAVGAAPSKARPRPAKAGQAGVKVRKEPTATVKAKIAPAAPAKPRAKRAKAAPAGAKADTGVPRQGFESDFDRASGPVAPPGGAELVATAAEIFGELAKAGISTGERLLKDVLTRLPLS